MQQGLSEMAFGWAYDSPFF